MQVRLVLEEPEPGVTVVKLTQTDVPEEDRFVLVSINLTFVFLVYFVHWILYVFWVCNVCEMQVWEFDGRGEHGERMEGSNLSQDKGGFWVWCLIVCPEMY